MKHIRFLRKTILFSKLLCVIVEKEEDVAAFGSFVDTGAAAGGAPKAAPAPAAAAPPPPAPAAAVSFFISHS